MTAAPLHFRVSAAHMEANRKSLAAAIELEEGMDAPRAAQAAAAVSTSLSGIACWPRLVLDEGRLGVDPNPNPNPDPSPSPNPNPTPNPNPSPNHRGQVDEGVGEGRRARRHDRLGLGLGLG